MPDRSGQLLLDLAPPGVQVADVGQQLGGELAARLGHRAGRATCSRILSAWPAVISSGTPPGISSHSTAWSRQTTWLRVRERSRWRLARTFSTTAWPSAVTSWRPLDRNAATATDRASFGSVLFVSPASGSRTRAASSGRTTPPARRRRPAAGPAAGPARGRLPPPRSAPASLRPGNQLPGLARAGPHPQLARQLPGRTDRNRGARALLRSDPDHHCHQCTPILTSDQTDRGGHALDRTRAGRSSLFRATPRQGPTEQAHRSKARHTAGRRIGSQPRRTSPDATSTAAPSSGGLYKAAPRAFSPTSFITQRDTSCRRTR